jgi:hypothetical protein
MDEGRPRALPLEPAKGRAFRIRLFGWICVLRVKGERLMGSVAKPKIFCDPMENACGARKKFDFI